MAGQPEAAPRTHFLITVQQGVEKTNRGRLFKNARMQGVLCL